LTNLANRRLLKDRFEQTNARAKRGEEFALHYIDLDYFKPINDKFGHKAGDAVLLEVARRLQSVTRETDTVARIGGDEFVILQSDARGENTANFLANRLISAISDPIYHDGYALSVTASIGIAFSMNGQHTLEEMMRQADMALYQSKKNGRNRAGLFEDQQNGIQLKGAA
jgi:diguanylate cyclase (GGDEF)-like protein